MIKIDTIDDYSNKFSFEEKITIKKIRDQIQKNFLLEGYRESFNKKNYVFQYNDTADKAYVVESGRIRTFQLTSEGKEVTFQILNSGEGFGLAELILNCPRMRYAETMCKTTLLVMNKEQLFSLFFSSYEFCFNQLRLLTIKIMSYQNIIEDLASLPVRDRVVKMLVRLCKEKGKQTEKSTIIDFPITHEEIAQMVGSSRQTVTYILNELRKEGIISWEQKKIKILRWMDLIEHFF